MTDEKLMLLEQINYIDKNVLNVAYGKVDSNGEEVKNSKSIKAPKILKMDPGQKVSDILADFDDEKIERLRNHKGTIPGARLSGPEWAGIMEALKNDKEICSLEVVKNEKKHNKNLQTFYKCPEEENEKQKYILVYKGTTGEEEWNDNVLGIGNVDTEGQLDALRFYHECVDDLGDNVEVETVGHSKGANKAMYVFSVAETANDPKYNGYKAHKVGEKPKPETEPVNRKITKCVGMDGQGMSNPNLEFYEQSYATIPAGAATNYSLDADFVHCLMKQIPQIDQVYMKGYGVAEMAQLHSPNSMFVADKNGKLILDGDQPQITSVNEDKNATAIHNWVQNIMDTGIANNLKSKVVGEYVGPIVGSAMTGDKFGTVANVVNNPVGGLGTLYQVQLADLFHPVDTNNMVTGIIDLKSNYDYNYYYEDKNSKTAKGVVNQDEASGNSASEKKKAIADNSEKNIPKNQPRGQYAR
jgi:hypothetical protein